MSGDVNKIISFFPQKKNIFMTFFSTKLSLAMFNDNFFGGQADTNMFIFWQSFSLDKERVLTLINLSLLKTYVLYFLLEDYRKNMEEYLRDQINMTE